MTQRLTIGKARDRSAEVTLAGADGRVRLAMRVMPDGMPSIEMFDADGKVVWQAP